MFLMFLISVHKASHSHDGATAGPVSGNFSHGKPRLKSSLMGTSSPAVSSKRNSNATNGPVTTALTKSAKPKT
jgi:hypothetical protein